METLDRFEWRMRNVEDVQVGGGADRGWVRGLAAGLKEGNLEWRTLPRDPYVLAQAGAYVPTSTGLLNADCSVMPVMVYTADHKAETIDRVVRAVERFSAENPDAGIVFRLAAGNVGVMAATNEEVAAAQFPILGYVYAAVIALCLLFFRSFAATLLHRRPPRRGVAAGLCADGGVGDRIEGVDPAGGGARHRHRGWITASTSTGGCVCTWRRGWISLRPGRRRWRPPARRWR